jgi:hypothetical protein
MVRAVIDTLKSEVPGLIAIEPEGDNLEAVQMAAPLYAHPLADPERSGHRPSPDKSGNRTSLRMPALSNLF